MMHESDLRVDSQLLAREMPDAVKVLVVDDDADILDLLRAVLDPLRYTLATADSARTGLELLRSFNPDVIVLDMLVKTGSLDILQQIRDNSQAPVLVLSAMNKPAVAVRALNNGADDYLVKPMKSSVLVAYLNKLARRGRAERVAHWASCNQPL